MPICLSDPNEVDQPLVWVNTAFERVTGYTAAEAVGRNCRFLQGPDTDRRAVDRLRLGLANGEAVTVTLLNHRRDGRPFWNHLSLSPLRDQSGRLIHYVGVQDDVTAEVEAAAARDRAVDELRTANVELTRVSEREHRAALTLQTGLLPRLQPIDGVRCAARYLPGTAGAAIGGDWYDVMALPDGRVAVSVGDVMGHDMRAAAAMGQLRAMTRALTWTDSQPASVLSRLDGLARTDLDITFATVFLGVLDLGRGEGSDAEMTWSTAGHPPPLLRRAAGDVVRLEGRPAPPIGVVRGRTVPQQSTSVPAGAALVLYTDGLVERRDRDVAHGIADLGGVLERATPDEADAVALCDAIVEALIPAHPTDDTCVLVVEL